MATITSSGPSNINILKETLETIKRAEDMREDVLERIQQQLAKVNEDENLKIGERHYQT